MTTTEYLQREIRRTELSVRRAELKPNTPLEELRGLHEKLEHLQEALKAVDEHWQRVHEQRGWTVGEPLTREQLIDMEGKPVLLKSPWWTEWCILSGHWENAMTGEMTGFTRVHGDTLCLSLADYGKTWTAYAYQPAHIDREAWEPCMWCALYAQFANKYCPSCGRPLTEEAWAELERKVFP